MTRVITGYRNDTMFRIFEEISAIPRGSGNEKAIAEYVESFIRNLGYPCVKDAHNNVFARKPATPGYENAPKVLFQAHMDMVCEKNSGVEHDFTKDPLKLYVENGFLKAEGTTLGADDGNGVAAMLALMADTTLKAPELEFLFTTDEENGMTGVENFDCSQIRSERMINLDCSGDGVATIGCAGSRGCEITKQCEWLSVSGNCYEIGITGLAGGHSGIDIHLGRANAILLMSQLLSQLYEEEPFQLVSLFGGDKLNAIPRECKAVICVRDKTFKEKILANAKWMKNHLSSADKNFSCKIRSASSERAMSFRSTREILAILELAPAGVLAMSQEYNGMVETSSNVAKVVCDSENIHVMMYVRSYIDACMERILRKYRYLAKCNGAQFTSLSSSGGWQPEKESVLRQCFAETVQELWCDKTPRFEVIHAGLECGFLKAKVPSLDILAIGPELYNLHSPDECLDLASYDNMYTLLKMLLAKLDH